MNLMPTIKQFAIGTIVAIVFILTISSAMAQENQMPTILGYGYSWNNAQNTSFTLYLNAIDPENDTLRYWFECDYDGSNDPDEYIYENEWVFVNYSSETYSNCQLYVTDDLTPPITNVVGDIDIPPNSQPIVCIENWMQDPTICEVTDTYTISYTDLNDCGTFDNLPYDNSTTEACNYCTIQFSPQLSPCINNSQTRTYSIDNYGSCCELTGITEDCIVPEPEELSCGVGLHDTNQITGLVIDFGVEYGQSMISFAGLIALIGVAGWMMFLL